MSSEEVRLDVIDGDDSPYATDLNRKQESGAIILSLACGNGYYRLVAGLLACGASINTQNTGGFPPLIMASLRGHAQSVRLLVRTGADTTLRSLGGLTAAGYTNSEESLDYLLSRDLSLPSGK